MAENNYSKNDMEKLLKKAENYCSGELVCCKYLYRNKEENYFNEILKKGRGIIKKNLKDNSGDPKSPINGKLEGIFFTASVDRLSIRGGGDSHLTLRSRPLANLHK